MFEMRFGGALRHQQAKDQVERVTVMGVVVERMPKAYERADAVVDAGHAGFQARMEGVRFEAGQAPAKLPGQSRRNARAGAHTSELQSLMRQTAGGLCLERT